MRVGETWGVDDDAPAEALDDSTIPPWLALPPIASGTVLVGLLWVRYQPRPTPPPMHYFMNVSLENVTNMTITYAEQENAGDPDPTG